MAPFSARRGTLTIRSERPEVPRAVPGKRRSELLRGGSRTRRFCIDSPPFDLELHRRDASHGRTVSRSGVYAGWPSIAGSLGPIAAQSKIWPPFGRHGRLRSRRSCYGQGVGNIPNSYKQFLDSNGLRGTRIGILRESMGYDAEPGSDDFSVAEVFDKAVAELKAAGAMIVDPVVIPRLKELLAKRAGSFADEEESFRNYLSRSATPPYKSARKQRIRRIFQRSVSVHRSAGQGPRQQHTMSISWRAKN